MKKVRKDHNLVKFSAPDPRTNIITVNRILPDKTEELIGQLYPDFIEGTETMSYRTVNAEGEELLPPTLDFIEIENHFEKSLHEISEQSLMKDMEARTGEFEKRNKGLKSLRNWKIRLTPKLLNR